MKTRQSYADRMIKSQEKDFRDVIVGHGVHWDLFVLGWVERRQHSAGSAHRPKDQDLSISIE